jgi:hypothetical protein
MRKNIVMTFKKGIVCALLGSLASVSVMVAQNAHPRLFLNRADVAAMRAAVGKYPLFDASLNLVKPKIDKALSAPMDVPIPKDAGGYTHERHKQNYTEMQLAGVFYAMTGEVKYADFVRTMLLKYAELYPRLGKHPAAAGEAAGRLFWQTLNETVWLVHATQAYDCIYDRLSVADRETIESKVIRPMAVFLSEERVHEMDRIHNHGTWSCAAVGMAGYVMNDKNLVEKALYGSKKDRSGGFLRQIDLLFSPDGFYTEGLYYVRYALLPFYTFAQVIENNQPELKIFEYRSQILKKAIYSALQLTYTNGAFIPINDALKEKTYLSPEIIVALDIAFSRYGGDANLLPVAVRHKEVMLSGAGVAVAKAIAAKKAPKEFPYKSVEYTDGSDGKEGGIGVLRYGPPDDQSMMIMKYTGHGLSHGHYDKLAILYYDQGREILQDYGSARLINVEPKYGGRYLPENKSFAMQTIAHNTITVDAQSHYNGDIRISERHHADRHFFQADDDMFQVMSAKVTMAYDGVSLQRTVAMVRDRLFKKPIVIDVFKVSSDKPHTYDLPYYYMGHLIYTNVKYTASDRQMSVLGSQNGYQHLWNEAEGTASGAVQVSWLAAERYYSITSAADTTTQVLFTRIGGSDPNFNLRHEPAFILRQKASSHVFASILEPHGAWDGTKETSENARSSIASVKVASTNREATAVEITGVEGWKWLMLISNGDGSKTASHTMLVDGKEYSWKGSTHLIKQ